MSKIIAVRETGHFQNGLIYSKYRVFYQSGVEKEYLYEPPKVVREFMSKSLKNGLF